MISNGVDAGIDGEPQHSRIPIVHGALEVFECLLFVFQRKVQISEVLRGDAHLPPLHVARELGKLRARLFLTPCDSMQPNNLYSPTHARVIGHIDCLAGLLDRLIAPALRVVHASENESGSRGSRIQRQRMLERLNRFPVVAFVVVG